MLGLQGYESPSPIASSGGIAMLRARTKAGLPVLVRTIEREHLSARTEALLRREHELSSRLGPPTTLACRELLEGPTGPALIFEHPPGQLMGELSSGEDMEQFLRLAIATAEALHRLHQTGISHRALQPWSFFVHEGQHHAQLLELGEATSLEVHSPPLVGPDRLGERLPYIAPEQTGRMNRAVDGRADLYALGVLLYQQATGQLPLQAADAIGWVHAHIARRPTPARLQRPGIPLIISNLLDRLLAKDAEERYQSAGGLLHDLERCADMMLRYGGVDPFPLGQADVPERFQIPTGLVGREVELGTLQRAFQATAAGPAGMLMVSGEPGIGKSRLIGALHRPVAEARGLYAQGKSEQFKRNIPYHPLIQAFQELCRDVMGRRDAELEAWRQSLLDALGLNASVACDMVPELAQLLGEVPEAPRLPAAEASRRFEVTIERFVRVFGQASHPLVLVLDDLHWADRATLDILQILLDGPSARHLMIIGGYRPEELGPDHPLQGLWERLEAQGLPLWKVHLGPLPQQDVLALVNQVVRRPAPELAELLHERSGGNPFFLHRLLQDLHRRDLISFQHGEGRWTWDMEGIRREGFAENALQLVSRRIQQLGPATRSTLGMAACVGARFEVGLLADIRGGRASGMAAELVAAADNELISPIGADYTLLEAGETAGAARFEFLHDRVQEAAYALVEAAEREHLHLRIGRTLLRRHPEGHLDEVIFDVVHHWNRASELLTDIRDRDRLAWLNLHAAQRARGANAHAAALSYLRSGLRVLGPDRWARQYQLTLEVMVHLAEAEMINSAPEEALRLGEDVLREARSPLDRVRIHELRILICNNRFQLKEGVDEALRVLELLGEQVAPAGAADGVARDLHEVHDLVQGRGADELSRLPELQDPAQQAAFRILCSSVPSAGMAAPQLYVPMLCHALRLALTRGVSIHASTAFAQYGVLLCSMGEVERGYQMGRLSQLLRRRFPLSEGSIGGLIEYPVFIQHWKEPISEVVASLSEARSLALELGHPLTLGYAVNQRFEHRLLLSESLSRLDADYHQDRALLVEHKQDLACSALDLWGQLVACLRGDAPAPAELVGTRSPGIRNLPFLIQNAVWPVVVFTSTAQAWLALLAGQRGPVLALTGDPALVTAVDSPPVKAMMPSLINRWFRALALLDPEVDPSAEEVAEARLLREGLAMAAHSCPSNHAHRLRALDAELCAAVGQPMEALRLYDEAVELASEFGLLADRALILERAARWHRRHGRRVVAQSLAEEACNAWMEWGASAAAEWLLQRWPQLLRPGQRRRSEGESRVDSHLDLDTVLKATRSLTGEIRLDRLISTLLRLVVENAGAERAFLILERDETLLVQGRALSGGAEIIVLEASPVDERDDLAVSIVQFVARTREPVLLAEASQEGRFTTSSYVSRVRPRSVLALPLMLQGRLMGVLYLENNLTAGAFTADRAELLRILCSQAATSIENATLYSELQSHSAELEEKNAQLTELDRMRDEFLANTSHELRTPLNGIIGIAQTLIDGVFGELPAPMSVNLEMIVSSGRRLSNLVNDILDLSTLRHGRITLRHTRVQVRAAVDVVVALARPLVGNKALDLRLEIPDDLPEAWADEDRIQQVLTNLVGNAVKFTESGEVLVRAEEREGYIRVAVRDTGIGIRKEVQERIFNSFEQADSSTSRVFGGTGLGLAVARQLVEQHGGEIGVESTPGEGSTFWFTLPVAANDAPSMALPPLPGRVAPPPTPIQELIRPVEPVDGHQPLVMVVDDEPINLQVMINLLGLLGYRVETSMSGRDALERIEGGLRPDLLVLDVMMPTISGLDVCRQLRRRWAPSELPIILLTARSLTKDLMEGLDAGANDYVTKPFAGGELTGRIQTQLRLSRFNQAAGRFVPHDFLRLLGRESIVDVQLGDSIEREMSVLFSDIRDFTRISELMTPEENFRFINRYLGFMEPMVNKHRGFIDKYIGDGVMALFDQGPDQAVAAGVDMLRALERYNAAHADRDPLRIGIGIHTGRLMLGTVGGLNRMESTVVSDTVNTAARVEGLTKDWQVGLLLTEPTVERLSSQEGLHLRLLDRVQVKGRSTVITVYEVYNADPEPLREAKDEGRADFERGVQAFHEGRVQEAAARFMGCLQRHPGDHQAVRYLSRCSPLRSET